MGGVRRCVTHNFLLLETLILRLLEMKSFVWHQDTFIIIHFAFQSKLRLKISDQNYENVTRGGGG